MAYSLRGLYWSMMALMYWLAALACSFAPMDGLAMAMASLSEPLYLSVARAYWSAPEC